MVHALMRGLSASDAGVRGPFLAWLLERGARPLDGAVAAPQLRRMMGKAAPSASGQGSSALELLLARASSSEAATEPLDAACAQLLQLMVRQASCVLPAKDLEAALSQARAACGGSLTVERSPATHAALHDAALAAHGVDSQLVPPPPPAVQQERLPLLLLSVERLDGLALYTRHAQQTELRMNVPPAAVRMAISLVHEPAKAADGDGTDPSPGTSSLEALKNVFGGGARGRAVSGAPADNLGALTLLVEERLSAPPLCVLPQGLQWHASWSALQLAGEEAALVLLQFVHPEAVTKGGERLIGWIAIAVDACGEHHAQLRPPPLPTSAVEARSTAGERLDLWVHLELRNAVTGSMGTLARLEGAMPHSHAAPQRMESVLFDPRGHGEASRAGYVAPRRSEPPSLLSSVVGVPAAVVSSAASAVSTTASTIKSSVSAVAEQITPTTPTRAHASSGTKAEASGAKAETAGADAADGLSSAQRAQLEALPAPKVRGKLPPRKWGKQPSREETHALLAAAAAAANSGESELALRGYLRAFEATRATPLLLSAANMHLRLGELDAAQAFCSALRELESGLSAEQRAVLGRKENEISAARRQKAPAAMSKRVSMWQHSLDHDQLAQLS